MKYQLHLFGRWVKKVYFTPLTLAPALIILIFYVYYPAFRSLYLSLNKTRLFDAVAFNGIAHYKSIFNDSEFWVAFRNTSIYAAGAISGTIIIGLSLAILLNSPLRGKTLFRTSFFMPYVIPYAAHTLLWEWLYDPRYGIWNYILGYLGVDAIPWITSRDWVLISFMIMNIWKRSGFAMVLFISGLQTIDDELYDSAKIDGANFINKFIHITLPLLSPIMLFVIVLSFLNTFQLFVEPFAMTKGGPGNSSLSIIYIIYEEGFRIVNSGRASAMAVFLFAFIFICTGLLRRRFDIKEI